MDMDFSYLFEAANSGLFDNLTEDDLINISLDQIAIKNMEIEQENMRYNEMIYREEDDDRLMREDMVEYMSGHPKLRKAPKAPKEDLIIPCFVPRELKNGYSIDLYQDGRLILEDTLCVRKIKEDGTLGEELEHGKFYTKYKYKYKYNFDGTTLHLPSCLSEDDKVIISYKYRVYGSNEYKGIEIFKLYASERKRRELWINQY